MAVVAPFFAEPLLVVEGGRRRIAAPFAIVPR